MEWTNLPTDYKDAVWNGNRKYSQINNSDGTVSFEDVTEYSQKENSFFGATEANAMNAAMNKLAANIDSVEKNAQSASSSATTASEKATAAANSQSAAASSATSAGNSATSASNSANTASEKATAAGNSATAAANSATSASNSATAAQTSAEKATALLYNNAGAHNSIYRGKYLGTSVTTAQWAAIKAGTFDDLYIGDYWTINNVNYRIAAFDYYYNTGDTACTTHHVVVVPDTSMYYIGMNDTNTTEGGYIGSKMYTTNLAQAKTTIDSAFGSAHILSHRQLFTNAVSNGRPSGGSWYDSTVDLMTEMNVYGCKIFACVGDGSTIPCNYEIDKSQYPLFALNPQMQSNRQYFWLRDIVSASNFAFVNFHGYANYYYASNSRGVRPAFCIKQS